MVAFFVAVFAVLVSAGAGWSQTLLNVSNDATRELFRAINPAFATEWKKKTGANVSVQQSHGGTQPQALAIIGGLRADILSVGFPGTFDAIAARTWFIPDDWRSKFPHNSSPYMSTIVFIVRKGNPRAIRDWSDVAKPGVSIAMGNPRTSGGSRWAYLAAWAWAAQTLGSEDKIRKFMTAFLNNVTTQDTTVRDALIGFSQEDAGDVLITFESEALRAITTARGDFELVAPSLSILTELPVTIIDEYVERNRTRAAAVAYIDFLYSAAGQRIIAQNNFRPRYPEQVVEADMSKFPKMKLVTVDQAFGGWSKAQAHFWQGGTLDQLWTR